MRPAKAAPAVPFAICRYANARTFALAIVAAFWPGGTITNPPCLTWTIIFSDWALLLSSLTVRFETRPGQALKSSWRS